MARAGSPPTACRSCSTPIPPAARACFAPTSPAPTRCGRRRAATVDSLVVFQGPQGYISPAWYPSKAEHGKVVPTWNYIVVQGRGAVRFIDDAEWLRAFVTRLTEGHEAGRTAAEGGRGAPVWAVSDAPADYVETMLKAIVGVEIPAELAGRQVEGEPEPSARRPRGRRRAASASRPGDEAAAMAQAVRDAGNTT